MSFNIDYIPTDYDSQWTVPSNHYQIVPCTQHWYPEYYPGYYPTNPYYIPVNPCPAVPVYPTIYIQPWIIQPDPKIAELEKRVEELERKLRGKK